MSRTWLKLVQEPPQDPMCSLKYKSEPDQLFHHWNFHTERFARKLIEKHFYGPFASVAEGIAGAVRERRKRPASHLQETVLSIYSRKQPKEIELVIQQVN